MDKFDDLIQQARDLLIKGEKLQLGEQERLDMGVLNLAYQRWYTKALAFVRFVTPERSADFEEAYKLPPRKEIAFNTYTIRDYLMGLVVKYRGQPAFDTDQAYSANLVRQLAILAAAIDAASDAIYNIRSVVQAELMDGDIMSARELAKAGHLRASGVVCGVVLEKHLKEVANRHGITFRKKNVTISDANDALKDHSVYDVPLWRLIQRLSDIRNLCAHSKDREPKREEVEDLIVGTEKVIKEVF